MGLEAIQQLMGYSAETAANPAHVNGMASHSFDQSQAIHMHMSMEHQQQQYTPAPPEVEEKKKKGGAAGAATNDKELRELLAKNEHRDLKDVAAEVIAADRSTRAEKCKQLFAMLWLRAACRVAKTSVPRNRVYSMYASRCADDRVIALNPASFGKLVRVIFPGISTRRLGVRGESKYHYVDLALVNDTGDVDDARRPATARTGTRQNSMAPTIDFNSTSRAPADTASFPPQEQAFGNNNSYSTRASSKGLLFADLYSTTYRPSTRLPTSITYECEMKFLPAEEMEVKDEVDLILPDITPYLPPGTDVDTAANLAAVYRTHCISLIDSVRFCKEKQFFRLFTALNGTLTVPSQRLFNSPELASWVKECDWMMYQKMIRNVAPLALQVAPAPVLKFLDKVYKQLHAHLSKTFGTHPPHLLEAKLEPAVNFAHLLRRMLRVNSTAHAAAAMLLPDDNRNHMWMDWMNYVNLKAIIENSLPQSCGHEQVYNILQNEIRALLTPLKPMVQTHDGRIHEWGTQKSNEDANDTSTCIDRIASFLMELPSRFPHAPARTMLYCINALGSAILREITVENGSSFQGWWLTKTFIDEMAEWLAAFGGFLDHSPPNWNSISYSPTLMNDPMNVGLANGSGSNNESRLSSMEAEYQQNQNFVANSNLYLQETGNSNSESESRFIYENSLGS